MRVLVVAPFVPYEGIPHAGGQYLAEYLRCLRAQGVEVSVVAPVSKSSIIDSAHNDLAPTLRVWCNVRRSLPIRSRDAFLHAWRAIDPGTGVMSGFNGDSEFRRLVEWADVIHVQYTELLPLVRSMRDMAKDTPIFCTEHDVFTQSVRRAIRSPSVRERAKAFVRYAHVAKREARLLNAVDQIYVFNPDNIPLLRSMGVRVSISLTDLFVPIVAKAAEVTHRSAIFAAAFSRLENQEAARWLLERVWPRVRERVPDGELFIVGNAPPDWLKKCANDNITVTGRVPAFAPYYLNAGVSVAPLQRGAGVKVKVLDGMAYGLPVVATTVAAEGIAGRGENKAPILIADTSSDFADALSGLFLDAGARVGLGREGRAWVQQQYDFPRSVGAIAADMQEAYLRRRSLER